MTEPRRHDINPALKIPYLLTLWLIAYAMDRVQRHPFPTTLREASLAWNAASDHDPDTPTGDTR